MERCKVCRKKPKLTRRVNCEGVVFCSDECYEGYEDSPNDHDHPYIDDYDAVRFEYIEWMKSYDSFLIGEQTKENLLEGIESVLEDFADYYLLEGSDGVFLREIYHYLLSLEELVLLIER
ncbi:hypothetical protein [Neobacillus sp. CF12]|uniref:hypothetical protein n=1 Tax=Neobacillus sp. CF12 TaxID=3055864 RepID=UPI0025A21E81|nr:hypothetical protein [Neobacillus sp. CF12]MDM5326357.1 hypothetical protein [Neobacillus sp. CF12]